MTRRLCSAFAAAAVLVALPAFAEESDFNLHIEPTVGTGINLAALVTGASLKVDFGILHIGPVQPQIEAFGIGSANPLYINGGSLFGAGIGLRWRILNDENGYALVRGGKSGNWWGNLWLDAHVLITSGGPRPGFDVGLGYEFSAVDGLQVGPFAQFRLAGRDQMMLFGLSFSVGGPPPAHDDDDPDGDGIKGALDKCPTVAEDKDNFEDTDGCPEDDNDKDGIPDATDQCRDEPETKNGFKDDDGCPDSVPDADNDGIPDSKDKCPNDPETFNKIDDEDGCPEKDATIFVTKEKIVITDKVNFDTGLATINASSDGLLDNLADILKKFPEVKKVRIEGHTDDVGEDAANQKLSEDRAASVLEALVRRGINRERLEAAGFGESKPLVKGEDDASRAKNRRVEFVIVQQ